MCCKGPLSTSLKRAMLMWSFSWHYEGMKEDALQKGLPVPDEAAVRERVLRKNVEAPDLATVEDFLRFQAATSKGKIREEVTSDSLNTFAEWFFAGFSRVTDTPTNDDDRREIYDVSTSCHLWKAPISPSPVGPESLARGRPRGQ